MKGGVIAKRMDAWGLDDLPLERELFGSAEPDAIERAVDDICVRLLGAGIDHYEFFDSSSGSVHGVTLVDGRRVVVKGHRGTVSGSYLEVVTGLQRDLANAGYPAPRPAAGPAPIGPGYVTIEALIPCDQRADGHDPAVRKVLAHGLADFVRLARSHRRALETVSHPMTTRAGDLYPPPHSLRFDFAATASEAEWIDDLAARARAAIKEIPGGEPVVAHGDWRIENVCVTDGAVTAVYDWDSLHVEREPIALAPAAATFSVDWSRAEGERFPSPREMAAFIAEYEAARTIDFAEAERRLLAAAIVASLAYGARCEHADRGRHPESDDCQRALLRRLGERLLDDGLAALAGT